MIPNDDQMIPETSGNKPENPETQLLNSGPLPESQENQPAEHPEADMPADTEAIGIEPTQPESEPSQVTAQETTPEDAPSPPEVFEAKPSPAPEAVLEEPVLAPTAEGNSAAPETQEAQPEPVLEEPILAPAAEETSAASETTEPQPETTSEEPETTPAAEEPVAVPETPAVQPAPHTELISAPSTDEAEAATNVENTGGPLPDDSGVYSTDRNKPEETVGDLEDLIRGIDEILHHSDDGDETILTGVSAAELTALVQHFLKQGNLDHARKCMEVVKKTFSALPADKIDQEDANQFKFSVSAFDTKIRTYHESQEQERKANAQKRQALIADLKSLVDKKDATLINEVREVQNAWKATGPAPRDLAEELNQEYRKLMDEFYEQRKLHKEMMEYDHKRNLEEKEKIIQRIIELVPAPEDREKPEAWRERQDQLSEIRHEWNDIGHVPREDMDRINEAYRSAVDAFFEVRQEFMALLDKVKEENAEKKEEILRLLESFREFTADRPRDWNQATDQLRVLQDTWKSVGPAPKSRNSELWTKYRDICSAFFEHKSTFFKTFDSERTANLDAKRSLAEQAEQWAESTEWDKAARELQRLQTEWRTVGAVPERFSNKLWHRFRKACDTFFERRRVANESQRSEETNNLKAKQAIIDALRAFSPDAFDSWDEAKKHIEDLNQQYRAIGHVPYKELNPLRDAFRAALTQANDQLHSSRGPRQPPRQKTAPIAEIKNPEKRNSAIDEQIRRLRRRISLSEETVSQYENNMGMIAKGKSGDPLRTTINQRIDQERSQIASLKKEIKELQEMSKRSEAEAEAKALAAMAAEAEETSQATEPEEALPDEPDPSPDTGPEAEQAPEPDEPQA